MILQLRILFICYTGYFPYDGQNRIQSSKRNRNDNKFVYDFLVICWYLNIAKKNTRGYVFSKWTIVTKLMFWTESGKIYVLCSWALCMIEDPFVRPNRDITHVKRIILKIETCKRPGENRSSQTCKQPGENRSSHLLPIFLCCRWANEET